MADSDNGDDGVTAADARDALDAAIAENPEAVVEFVERLDTANRLLDTTALGLAAMDDEMVQTLARAGGTLAEAGDGLATRETVRMAETVGANAEHLEAGVETLARLEKDGTLEELANIGQALTLMTAAMDDEMIQSLASTAGALGDVADTMSDPDTVDGLEALLGAVGDATDLREPPEEMGALGLVRAMRDPNVKRGLGYLVAIARSLGEDLDRAAGDRQ